MAGELRAKREALETLWQQGLSGKTLLERHSRLIDEYLARLFAACPEAQAGMTLVALGGYGRGELFPFSDIDLLLLYEPGLEQQLTAVTETIFYPLWDAGLEVGHGVRTPEACLTDAGEDFFFLVSLLDARVLAGDPHLFATLQKTFREDFIEGRRKDFLRKMVFHREQRLQRYGMESYQLEPHIKESRGGLRDIQAILWTAQALFGLKTLDDVEEAGLLTKTEHQNFEEAWNNLVRIRNRLHYINGRKKDQLHLEYQDDMAAVFGYKSSDGLLGVEHFMRDVYGHLHTVSTTTDLFFEHVDETLGLTRPNTSGATPEPGMEIRHGRIHLADQGLISKRPLIMVRLFAQAAKTGLPIHHRTRKLVSANLHLVDDKLRRSRRAAKAFMEILLEAAEPLEVLTTMLDTGLLHAYIPEFAHVKSLAQHDVYHVFTVDRHLLQTVAELKRLRETENVFREISGPHVLFLAALLHDIGKGRGGNHSELGAVLVKTIGGRLGLPEPEVDCLAFLLRHHLFLMTTALRRDLEDEAFILRCARLIQDPERLRMLYLLSIADTRATNPSFWNEWKATLLLELYLKVAHLLDRSDLADPDRVQGAQWMRSQLARLLKEKPGIDLDSLSEEYLLSFPPETVALHLERRRELMERNALLYPEKKKGYSSLLIMAHDSTGLLAKICGTLALHNLKVIKAHIHTWPDNTAVDVLDVQPSVDVDHEAQDWRALERDLNLAVGNRLGLTHRLEDKYRLSRYTGQRREPHTGPRVEIDNHTSASHSIIEVYAEDTAGLLYNVTRTLADFGINISRAKISVAGDQVVDVFYATDSDGRKIIDPDFQEEIRRGLLHIAASIRNAA